MSCSVPSWLKDWFNHHFKPACDWHDERYVQRDLPKTMADIGVGIRISLLRWWALPIGLAAIVLLLLLPKAYGMWYRDENNTWRW